MYRATNQDVEGRPLEDAELIELARDGDVRAYGELVVRYREPAFRMAVLVTQSAAEAEDAVQEAFVKAYYALARFRSPAPFRPWILRIVSNEARNRQRSARRREGLALEGLALRVAEERLSETRPRLPRRQSSSSRPAAPSSRRSIPFRSGSGS